MIIEQFNCDLAKLFITLRFIYIEIAETGNNFALFYKRFLSDGL